jgi:hypothetical protein
MVGRSPISHRWTSFLRYFTACVISCRCQFLDGVVVELHQTMEASSAPVRHEKGFTGWVPCG